MKSWLIEHQVSLSRQIETQKLPHAILISGVSGSGKTELSQWLIQILLCQQPQKHINEDQEKYLAACGQCKACLLYKNKSYPDHFVVESDTKTIGVDSVRKANHFFESTALLGKYKSVIIPNADAMTVSAANALLKTLEEPSDDSMIILTTVESDLLLPTIISRCRLINIRPNNNYSKGNPAQIVSYSELTDSKFAEKYLKIEQDFYRYIMTRTGRSQLLSELVSSAHSLRWLEKISVDLMLKGNGWNDKIQMVRHDNSLVEVSYNRDILWHIYKVVVACTKQLKTLNQANIQFAMEKLLVDIYDIVSTEGE